MALEAAIRATGRWARHLIKNHSGHCPVREWAALGFLGRWVEGNRGTQKAGISISMEESGEEVIFMKEVCRTKLRVAVFCQRKMDVRIPH